jgi:hypothetical protein
MEVVGPVLTIFVYKKAAKLKAAREGYIYKYMVPN